MKLLYNPSLEPVTVEFDKYGENPEKHILEATSYGKFEDHIAELIIQKLIDRLYWENRSKKGRDKLLKELRERIEVK